MKVYDVVNIVDPGALTSILAGRWHVVFYAEREPAERYAESCRRRTLVPGVDYHVEEHEETCPGRATEYRWGTNTNGLCTCKGEGV